MLPRFKSTLFKAIFAVCLCIFSMYVFHTWHNFGTDLQSVIYRYKKVYKRAWRYEKEDEFENVFEDLMTMERFSMVLNKPQEPILLPALLKRHRIISKNKTHGKQSGSKVRDPKYITKPISRKSKNQDQIY